MLCRSIRYLGMLSSSPARTLSAVVSAIIESFFASTSKHSRSASWTSNGGRQPLTDKFWLNLQTSHDIRVAAQQAGAEIARLPQRSEPGPRPSTERTAPAARFQEKPQGIEIPCSRPKIPCSCEKIPCSFGLREFGLQRIEITIKYPGFADRR
jgi:hypothetical protein